MNSKYQGERHLLSAPGAVPAGALVRIVAFRTWSGMGHVAAGMARQGYDLQLTRYDEKGWRATF